MLLRPKSVPSSPCRLAHHPIPAQFADEVDAHFDRAMLHTHVGINTNSLNDFYDPIPSQIIILRSELTVSAQAWESRDLKEIRPKTVGG